MVYCLPKEDEPQGEEVKEKVVYTDASGIDWSLTRVEDGVFLSCLGEVEDSVFEVNVEGYEVVYLNNTNCIFFNNTQFDVFYDLKELIQKSITNEMWCAIVTFLEARLEKDFTILDCEIEK